MICVSAPSGKKKETTNKQSKNHENTDSTANGVKKAKKKKVQKNAESVVQDTKGGLECSQDLGEGGQAQSASPETDIKTPAKKKKKRLKATSSLEGELHVNGVSSEMDVASSVCEDSAEDNTAVGLENMTDAATPAKKKAKKKSLKGDELPQTVTDQIKADDINAEINSEAAQHNVSVPLKKAAKKKGKQETKTDQTPEESSAADECLPTPQAKKKKKNLKECQKAVEEEGAAEAESSQVADAEKVLFEDAMATPAKKKNTTKLKTAKTKQIQHESQSEDAGCTNAELPLDEADVVSASGKAVKKKRKIPVVFEYEADELEGASVNGHVQLETVPKKTKLVNVSIESGGMVESVGHNGLLN